MAGEHTSHGPMYQFEVRSLLSEPWMVGPYDISFTNSSLFMVLAVVASLAFLIGGIRKQALVPNRWQSLVELTYEFVAGMVKENVGTAGRKYFPFIFTLFMFILLCNLLGMMPYSFTVTSHIAVTFALAAFVFVAITIIGFVRHGFGYCRMFLPEGVPLALAPLMICIELVSYFTRPVTLSLRLAGNMMAGHILLKVLAMFVVTMGLWGVFPLVLIVCFVAFEFLVAVLQAYIFSLLVCIYLNDAVHLH